MFKNKRLALRSMIVTVFGLTGVAFGIACGATTWVDSPLPFTATAVLSVTLGTGAAAVVTAGGVQVAKRIEKERTDAAQALLVQAHQYEVASIVLDQSAAQQEQQLRYGITPSFEHNVDDQGEPIHPSEQRRLAEHASEVAEILLRDAQRYDSSLNDFTIDDLTYHARQHIADTEHERRQNPPSFGDLGF